MTVHVRVDHAALVRGHVEAGEVCEIPGVGAIPVATAEALAGDAIISGLLTNGTDVTRVNHMGRTITAPLRTALVERDPCCAVPGCEVRHGLEIDHDVSVVKGGRSKLENLDRLCGWHHYLKTHHGYRLIGERGARVWTPGPRRE